MDMCVCATHLGAACDLSQNDPRSMIMIMMIIITIIMNHHHHHYYWWENQDKHGCLLVLDKKNHSTHNLRTLPFHICRSLPHCSMNQRANLEMHAKSLRLRKQSSRYQLLSHQKMTQLRISNDLFTSCRETKDNDGASM